MKQHSTYVEAERQGTRSDAVELTRSILLERQSRDA